MIFLILPTLPLFLMSTGNFKQGHLMERKYNLRGISATLLILQEIGSTWCLTLPASALSSYEHLIVPDFNLEACNDCQTV